MAFNLKLKRIAQFSFLLFLIVGTVFILKRHKPTVLHHYSGSIFGTVYNIKYVGKDSLESQILAELHCVDLSLSMFNPNSTVSRINTNKSSQTDEMLCEVFTLSKKISQQTQGAFDVTVAPLVNAWGFGYKNKTDLTDRQVDSLLAFVGMDKIRLVEERIVKNDERIMLDFSSVAKGYAVDRIARLLTKHSVNDFMVEIGGEVVARGQHPDGRPWEIGIAQPANNGNHIQKVLRVKDKALATSGNYRRFYVKNGKRYAHTINPHTGKPIQHDVLSATVIASDCATADAYATAFMVLGKKRTQEVLSKHSEIAAFLIYTVENGDYATWASQNFQDEKD